MSESLMTYKEVASRLGMSVRKVHDLKEAGDISYIKWGRSIRFKWEQVEADMAKRTVKARRVA